MSCQAPFDLKRYDNRVAASTALASQTAASLQQAIRENGFATIALTGGSSPSDLYSAWANDHRTSIDWSKVHFFWGDERNVPHDHPDSNVVLARAMLDDLNIPSSNIHVWRTDLSPSAALQDMRQVLRKLNMLEGNSFTVTLFGMGEDGHIASLFPNHTPWKDLGDAFPAVARFIVDSPKPPSERYTFTLPFINRSSEIHLLPFGKTKKLTLEKVMAGDTSLPATHLSNSDTVTIWTDYAM